MNTTTPTALTLTLLALSATGCGTLATVQGPQNQQRLTQPQPVTVALGPAADVDSFSASLNGADITCAFTPVATEGGEGFRFADHRFGPGVQHLSVHVASTNGKETLDHDVRFFPPALTAQGNIGSTANSRVRLTESGSARMTVKLPAAPRKATTLTLTPRAAEGDAAFSFGDAEPGESIQITLPAGRRVAMLELHAATAGVAMIQLSAPGYAATVLPVEVRPAFADILGKGSDLRKVGSGSAPAAGEAEAAPAADAPVDAAATTGDSAPAEQSVAVPTP